MLMVWACILEAGVVNEVNLILASKGDGVIKSPGGKGLLVHCTVH